ncbi:MAG TPA: cytochrome c oxidase subunit 4 [Dermatophilaceae bacterium]|nr:cytochrome c oxidase subunit 4 [Dermatophilaceae bacterium]
MRASIIMFRALGVFMAVMTGVYYYWTNTHYALGLEPIGIVALLLTALMMFMVAWYLGYTQKHTPEGPEDNPEGEIAEAEGDYGFFTPYSWWPLWLALSCAILFAGVAVGWWLFMIGAILAPVALVGWTFEHFKGEHAN